MKEQILSFHFEQSRPELRGNEFYHVGISGGKDSVAVLLFMLRCSGIPKERILASWCDIGNDHELTREHVKWVSENLHPVETLYPEKDFFQLALERKRFPSTCARFCTEELKIIPTAEHIQRLKLSGKRVIGVSGVRSRESRERAKLSEWDFSGNLFCWQWRPILDWSLKDVLEFHEICKVPMNPLYALGAKRVGCWPCIMSNKAELRNIALNFPERIEQIRKAEQRFESQYGRYSTFFRPNMVPKRFRSHLDKKSGVMCATIDDVARWSLTGKRAVGSWKDNPENVQSCNGGYCE